MRTTKYFMYAFLGVAAILLLTSDRAKTMRDALEAKAMDKAKRWKEKLSKLKADADGVDAELKHS